MLLSVYPARTRTSAHGNSFHVRSDARPKGRQAGAWTGRSAKRNRPTGDAAGEGLRGAACNKAKPARGERSTRDLGSSAWEPAVQVPMQEAAEEPEGDGHVEGNGPGHASHARFRAVTGHRPESARRRDQPGGNSQQQPRLETISSCEAEQDEPGYRDEGDTDRAKCEGDEVERKGRLPEERIGRCGRQPEFKQEDRKRRDEERNDHGSAPSQPAERGRGGAASSSMHRILRRKRGA